MVAQPVFLIKKWAPSAPKVLPMNEKMHKKSYQRVSRVRKRNPKVALFGSTPGGLREALTIISCSRISTFWESESFRILDTTVHQKH